jgi:imidazolonepropionase-like amidohydrolase
MGGDNEQPGDGCGSVNIETLQGWREEIERGERIGPKLVLAGPVASARTWTEDEQPQRARAAVQEAARRGADFIKVYEDFTPDGFAALMDEASKVGLPVAGHASEETLTILEAIEAGQRSIEHVRSHLLVCFAESDEELIAFYDADDWNDDDRAWGARHRTDCDAVWSALRERKTWLTSTLAVESTQLAALNPGFEDDPRRDRFPNSVKMGAATHAERMRARLSDDDERAMSENWWRTQLKFAARAAAEDAPLLSGSDAVCEGVIPGDGLIAQLEFLVEAGLTPLEALQTATSEPAAYFERSDQQGRIAPGYEADLVLLNSDPRADIAALHDIEGVLVRGKFLGSDTVERLKRPVFRQ